MKGRKKKEEVQTDDAVLETNENPFNELLDAVVEDLQARASQEVDPFNHYIQTVHSRLHADINQFRTRFAKGYSLLVEQLKT